MTREASCKDKGHFPQNVVPSDFVQVLWPTLLGLNRGQHFLLTGRKILAEEALDLGIVAEVLPRDRLSARAWEIARDLASRPEVVRRYTRVILTLEWRRLSLAHLNEGLALGGIAHIHLGGTAHLD